MSAAKLAGITLQFEILRFEVLRFSLLRPETLWRAILPLAALLKMLRPEPLCCGFLLRWWQHPSAAMPAAERRRGRRARGPRSQVRTFFV